MRPRAPCDGPGQAPPDHDHAVRPGKRHGHVEAPIEAGLNADALNPRAVAVGVPPLGGEQRAVREVTDEAGEEVERLVKAKIKELWT